MKKIVLTFILSIFYIFSYSQDTKNNIEQVKTYYLVRHAEKKIGDTSNRDPRLTKKGQQCANNLVNVLQNIQFDAVYSTNYIRTKETAKPIVAANKLETIIYDVKEFDFKKFINETSMTINLVTQGKSKIQRLL